MDEEASSGQGENHEKDAVVSEFDLGAPGARVEAGNAQPRNMCVLGNWVEICQKLCHNRNIFSEGMCKLWTLVLVI